jgi:hypothetical protein
VVGGRALSEKEKIKYGKVWLVKIVYMTEMFEGSPLIEIVDTGNLIMAKVYKYSSPVIST